jgi:xanthosine utilization system XapX-like protein
MQALWFLTRRLLVNSLRRTLTNPLRAILAALVVLWFVFMVGGNLLFSLSEQHHRAPPTIADLRMLNVERLTALLMGIHLFMLWQPLSPWMGFLSVPLFTHADVNFLFPSPQRRLAVFLFLLFTRGVANSLFLLLILLVMFVAMAGDLLVSLLAGGAPASARLAWVYPAMYLLAFLALLVCGILVSLLDERHEGFRRRLQWAAGAMVGMLAAFLGWQAYRAWRSGTDPLQEVVWHVVHHPVITLLLLPVRALAEAALAWAGGWNLFVALGFVFWGMLAAGAIYLLKRREDALYDLATKIASFSTTQLLRRQNPARAAYESAIAALQKRQKAVGGHPLARWTPQGAWALLWCHSLLMMRLSRGLQTTILMFIGALTATLLLVLHSSGFGPSDDPVSAVGFQYLFTFFLLLTSQGWLASVVRRAEMNKALPFSKRVVLLTEVVPPSLMVWLYQVLFWAVMSAVSPGHLWTWGYHTVIGMSFVPGLIAVMLTMYLLFPDQSDYTHRMLLGVLLFPVLLLSALPALLIGGIAILFDLPLWARAVCFVGANAGMFWGALSVAAAQYVHLNPAD